MFRKILITLLVISLIGIASLGAVSANDNSITVQNNKTFTDIQNQIDETCENATIELNEITQVREKKYKSTNRLPSLPKMEQCLMKMENPQYSILQTLTYA